MDDKKNQGHERETQSHDPFMDIPQIYFNALKVSRTPYDFQIIFGQSVVNGYSSDGEVFIRPHFVGQTSPQHFKAMVRVLKKQLDDFETEFGEIPEASPKQNAN